ncbi:MAG: hypothetical protein ACOVQH_02775 [Burkholderiaceae bacterium]
MAESIVTLSADDTALLKAFQKHQASQAKTDDGYVKNEKASKKAADQAIKDAERVERESKKNADAMFREHQKLLDQKDLENRKAAQRQEALARDTAFAEVKAAIKAAEQEIAATEKILKAKEKAAEKEQKLSGSSLEGLGKMALGFLTVDAAIQTVSETQKRFVMQMRESVELVQKMATAQQEASKNLAGNSNEAISDILLKKVPAIATKANFSDLPKLTTAIGSVASIIGDDAAPGVVEEVAKLTRNKKEDLQSTATAVADIMKALGIKDAKTAIALALSSGSVARPEEFSKLAEGLSKSILAAIASNPNQDPIEAAKDGAALFSFLTKIDKEGRSSATAAGQIQGLFRETFSPTVDDRMKMDTRIRELSEKNAITPEEQVAIDRANFSLLQKEKIANAFKPEDIGIKASDARLDYAEAKAALVRATESATLGKSDLEELNRLEAQKQLSSEDPGSFVGRLQKVQQNPELNRLVESLLSTEEVFKPIAKGLLDPNSEQMKDFLKVRSATSTDVSVFDAGLETMNLTPQQKLAFAMEKSDTGIAVKNFGDLETQTLGTVDEITQKALKANPNTGIMALLEGFSDFAWNRIGFGGDPSVASWGANPVQAVDKAILSLRDRQVDVGDWATGDPESMSKSARDKIRSLEVSIEALKQVKDDYLAKSLEQIADAMKENNDLLRQGNNKVDNQTNVIKESGDPSRAGAIRAQVARAKDN